MMQHLERVAKQLCVEHARVHQIDKNPQEAEFAMQKRMRGSPLQL